MLKRMARIFAVWCVAAYSFAAVSIAFAAESAGIRNVSVTVDQTERKAVITGQTDAGPGHEVTLMILDPSGEIVFLDQTTSGDDGAFTFTCKPDGNEDGTYMVRIGGEGIETPYQTEFRLGEGAPSPVPSGTLSGPEETEAGPFEVTFGLSGVQQPVQALDVTITYDKDVLKYLGADPNLPNPDFRLVGEDHKDGRVRLLLANLGDPRQDVNGPLLKLGFRAKNSNIGGTTAITATGITIADATGAETELADAVHNVRIAGVDKSALLALIAEAQAAHDAAVEGTAPGQYPPGSKAALQAAIDEARAVADDPEATANKVRKAYDRLSAALQKFRDSVNKGMPGDVNGDNRVSVGDLALVAAAYGKTSADPDWERYRLLDLSEDGKIDIEDLAAIARLILG